MLFIRCTVDLLLVLQAVDALRTVVGQRNKIMGCQYIPLYMRCPYIYLFFYFDDNRSESTSPDAQQQRRRKGVQWYTGVPWGAERFVASCHKDHEGANWRRALTWTAEEEPLGRGVPRGEEKRGKRGRIQIAIFVYAVEESARGEQADRIATCTQLPVTGRRWQCRNR